MKYLSGRMRLIRTIFFLCFILTLSHVTFCQEKERSLTLDFESSDELINGYLVVKYQIEGRAGDFMSIKTDSSIETFIFPTTRRLYISGFNRLVDTGFRGRDWRVNFKEDGTYSVFFLLKTFRDNRQYEIRYSHRNEFKKAFDKNFYLELSQLLFAESPDSFYGEQSANLSMTPIRFIQAKGDYNLGAKSNHLVKLDLRMLNRAFIESFQSDIQHFYRTESLVYDYIMYPRIGEEHQRRGDFLLNRLKRAGLFFKKKGDSIIRTNGLEKELPIVLWYELRIRDLSSIVRFQSELRTVYKRDTFQRWSRVNPSDGDSIFNIRLRDFRELNYLLFKCNEGRKRRDSVYLHNNIRFPEDVSYWERMREDQVNYLARSIHQTPFGESRLQDIEALINSFDPPPEPSSIRTFQIESDALTDGLWGLKKTITTHLDSTNYPKSRTIVTARGFAIITPDEQFDSKGKALALPYRFSDDFQPIHYSSTPISEYFQRLWSGNVAYHRFFLFYVAENESPIFAGRLAMNLDSVRIRIKSLPELSNGSIKSTMFSNVLGKSYSVSLMIYEFKREDTQEVAVFSPEAMVSIEDHILNSKMDQLIKSLFDDE